MKLTVSEMKDTQSNLQECDSLYFAYNFLQLTRYLSLYCESMEMLCVFNNSLPALRKICDRLLDNNFSAQTKWQKGVTQGAVSCHSISNQELASFMLIRFTNMKRNMVLNFE